MKYTDLLNKTLSELESNSTFTTFLPCKMWKTDDEIIQFNKHKGITFTFDLETGRLKQIDFFSKGYQGYGLYSGELPKQLRFDMGKEEVNKILGEPSQHSIAKTLPILGQIPAGDSYDYSSCRLIIRYSDTLENILLVTLCAE